MVLEVEGLDGALDPVNVQHKLEHVAGVSRVLFRENRGKASLFEVESLKDRSIRGDLARTVVQSGWNLNELRPSAMSLEEVFLQLTGADPHTDVTAPPPAAAHANIEEVKQ